MASSVRDLVTSSTTAPYSSEAEPLVIDFHLLVARVLHVEDLTKTYALIKVTRNLVFFHPIRSDPKATRR